MIGRHARCGLAAMMGAILLADVATAPAQEAAPGGMAREQIEEIVRDYILSHPEVVMEALTILQERQEQAELEKQRMILVERREQIFNSPTTPVIGNPEGDVTLVEFFDYQCGYCKRMHEPMQQLVGTDEGLRVVMKEFPILGPASLTAAQAALASRGQGLYEDYHNALMAHRGQMTEEAIFGLAEEVGLDVERLRSDMASPEVAAEIEANLELAQAIGVRGTPAFVIGDQIVPGAVGLEALEGLIAQHRPG